MMQAFFAVSSEQWVMQVYVWCLDAAASKRRLQDLACTPTQRANHGVAETRRGAGHFARPGAALSVLRGPRQAWQSLSAAEPGI